MAFSGVMFCAENGYKITQNGLLARLDLCYNFDNKGFHLFGVYEVIVQLNGKFPVLALYKGVALLTISENAWPKKIAFVNQRTMKVAAKRGARA